MERYRSLLVGFLCFLMVLFSCIGSTYAREVDEKDSSVEIEGACLKGATLRLADAAGNIVDEWVTDDTAHSIERLIAGHTYTLSEVKPAPGYATAAPVSFTVKDTADIQKIVMADAPVLFDILKIDKETGTPLKGASLKLTDKEGNVIAAWVSDEQAHRVEKLIVGQSYTLVEEAPPDGYVTAEPVTFIVEDTAAIQTIEMTGAVTKVEIYKVDSTTGEPVANAVLEVCDSDAHIIRRWETSAKPYELLHLTAGEDYTLKEVHPPTGYVPARDLSFRVADTKEVQKVVMKNEKDFTAAGIITSGIDFGALGVVMPVDAAQTGDTFSFYIPAGVLVISFFICMCMLYKKLK